MATGGLTFARDDDVLLLVHVVLVAFDVAAPALESGGRLEHVPQRLGARLAVGGEVVERGDELVALVADVAGLLPDLHRELGLLFTLALVGVEDLLAAVVGKGDDEGQSEAAVCSRHLTRGRAPDTRLC